MPGCKNIYDEAVAEMAEFEETPWTAEPCGALRSTLSDLNRYMENFKPAYESYAEKQAAAKANMGEIVFSKEPIDPDKMTNKSMAAEMQSLLENAGWEDIHRINIVDKDWWIDRISGGDSPAKSRHLAAAALAKDDDGFYYKVCTLHQDKLLTGGFGDLYLSHQGDRVPIPKANIDK